MDLQVGVALTDVTTGLFANGSISAALYAREKSGRGQKVRLRLSLARRSRDFRVVPVLLRCFVCSVHFIHNADRVCNRLNSLYWRQRLRGLLILPRTTY